MSEPSSARESSLQSVVIVGCGGFARNYLPVYRQQSHLRVLACIDADIEAARQMAQLLGAPHASSHFEDAVAS
ncbi:MAG TPA: Gfo/Idh/MocA family oxidoreductase, partial [Opitutaceae bacterium]|nr:Gfo/Idh/MocA family oxidoreductase [Opitutaceae bacterium]